MHQSIKTNKEWHEKNRMPKNSIFAQRVTWHKEHAKNCECRPIQESIKKEIEK